MAVEIRVVGCFLLASPLFAFFSPVFASVAKQTTKKSKK